MKVLISKSDYLCSVDSITGCQADKVVQGTSPFCMPEASYPLRARLALWGLLVGFFRKKMLLFYWFVTHAQSLLLPG